jgi:hypothetical protein
LSLTAPQDATVADGCIRPSILSRFAVRERRLFGSSVMTRKLADLATSPTMRGSTLNISCNDRSRTLTNGSGPRARSGVEGVEWVSWRNTSMRRGRPFATRIAIRPSKTSMPKGTPRKPDSKRIGLRESSLRPRLAEVAGLDRLNPRRRTAALDGSDRRTSSICGAIAARRSRTGLSISPGANGVGLKAACLRGRHRRGS